MREVGAGRAALLLAAGIVWVTGLGTPAEAAAAPRVTAYPSPNTGYASPRTQLSLRGVTPATVGPVVMTGSRTGAHSFTVRAHSDGKGVSLVPTTPFKRKEVVSIGTTLNVRGSRNGDFQIRTAPTGNHVKARPHEARDRRSQIQFLHSRSDLRPTRVRVTKARRGVDSGHVFVAPKRGPGDTGPMILDNRGRTLWTHRVPKSLEAFDFKPQRLNGKPVLTWWEGFVNYGTGTGVGKIYDDRYREIAEVKAGNGYDGLDPHEFKLTSRGTALVMIQDLVYADARKVGGDDEVQAFDAIVQEIDIATGLVLFEWHSLDHVGVTESYIRAPKKRDRLFDYFHINSIEELPKGNLLLSARNTWGVYKIDKYSGNVDWRLGGKKSSFRMGRGSRFAWQHDARVHKSGAITIFDNGAAPPVHSVSRGIGIRVRGKNARLIKDYRHSRKLLSGSQGNAQRLPNGNVFVGWGANRVFSEYSPHGRELFSANLTRGNQTYRAYRAEWTGRPVSGPSAVASTDGRNTKVYASWNGATGIARWDILGGSAPNALTRMGSVRFEGLESDVQVRGARPYVAVQAKDANGRVLATSGAFRARRVKR